MERCMTDIVMSVIYQVYLLPFVYAAIIKIKTGLGEQFVPYQNYEKI